MNEFRKLGLISYNGKLEVHRSLMDAVLRDKSELKEDEYAVLAVANLKKPTASG
jgi:hypothetical protein